MDHALDDGRPRPSWMAAHHLRFECNPAIPAARAGGGFVPPRRSAERDSGLAGRSHVAFAQTLGAVWVDAGIRRNIRRGARPRRPTRRVCGGAPSHPELADCHVGDKLRPVSVGRCRNVEYSQTC